MNRVIIFLLINVMISSSFGQKVKSLKSAEDSLAYAIGISMYQSVASINADIDLKLLAGGMKAAKKEETLLTPEEAKTYIQEYLMQKEARRFEKSKEAGNVFLEKNKKEKGVVVTESGLQYTVLLAGDGPVPTAQDKVKVHYTGTLLDGTVFDSSVERGEPAVFGVTQVIKGWVEVLQLMPVGSKYKVFIPSDLAYGDRSAGEDIKPGSALIFEIELLEIVSK